MALRKGDAARADLEERRGRLSVQPTHDSNTSDTQPTHKRSTLNRRDIRISDADWNALNREADRRGTSVAAIIRELVRSHLER